MRRLLAIFAFFGIAGSTLAQDIRPYRVPVHHADPWFIKAMLEGIETQQPEMSTVPGFRGLGQAAVVGAAKLLKGGTLRVNPTDNSLWFIPDHG